MCQVKKRHYCESLPQGFGCCGTKTTILKRGEIATYHHDELFGLKWKDKQVASMLLSICDVTMVPRNACTQPTITWKGGNNLGSYR